MNNIEESHATNLNISFYGSVYAIRIWKTVIRALGYPQFIGLRLNKENNKILVTPCREHDILSFKVPDDFKDNADQKIEIHSKPFLKSFWKANNLDKDTSYIITGTHLELQNVVIFEVKDIRIIDKNSKEINEDISIP